MNPRKKVSVLLPEKGENPIISIFLVSEMQTNLRGYCILKEHVDAEDILRAQYDCYNKIMSDPPHADGAFCPRTWDGWMCWDDTPEGTMASQFCPPYFKDFDTFEKVTKICNASGAWFRHPESQRTWSNYTLCNAFTEKRAQTTLNMYYLAVIGHGLSIVSLLFSLLIFFYFKSLSCQRITLHKNLFSSYLLNSVVTIILLSMVVTSKSFISSNPVGCRVVQFLHQYLMGCNYFWMLCEGIHLHTLVVVAVFAEEQELVWYYLLGWGFPFIPAILHTISRSLYYDDDCWISSETSLLYILHGTFVTALVVNLFFLLNIVRVLLTKLSDTHRAESHMYMKAVRATLILVPLLGIQYVLVPWRPEGHVAGEMYESIMQIFVNYQGLLVATIFCFFNGEVQVVLTRHWSQCRRRQFGSARDAGRSSSYTGTSITDMPGYTSHTGWNNGEHANGKSSDGILCLKNQPIPM
ncbi:unnamed protein product [Lampetra planeri]